MRLPRLGFLVAVVCFSVSCCSSLLFAAEPRPLDLKPGEELSYRVEKILTGSVKVLGEGEKTDEKWIFDLAVTAGEKDEKGRIPLALKVTHVEGSVPVQTGLTQRQTEFDDTKWKAAAAPVAPSFLQYLVLKEKSLQLFYEPGGKLAQVRGSKEVGERIDAQMARYFQNQPDFPNTRVLYKLIYTDELQKVLWDDLLIVDLPADFSPGVEWKEKRLSFVQPFYVWMDATHLAEEQADGALELETRYNMPKSKPANIRFGNQDYDYAVKNGTGDGKFTLDPDGKVRKLETTWHVYLDVTLNAGGQRIPFDEFYHRVKFRIERKDDEKRP